MAKVIELNHGYRALLDDEDYGRLCSYRWRVLPIKPTPYKKQYAITNISTPKGKRHLYLHREVLCVAADQKVDHINGDTLDNRRENLRVATNSQNQQNRRITGGSSRYKGVAWHKGCGKWQAQIKADGKRFYLGLHDTEIQAAEAYDDAASRFFGDYAKLNLARKAVKG